VADEESKPANDAAAIVRLPIATLKPDPRNPRKMEPGAAAGLAVSLETFGPLDVVFNDETGELVSGHQRVAQLRAAGAVEVVREGDAGYIEHPKTGDRFPVRFVRWDAVKQRMANLVANNPALQGMFTEEVIEQARSLEDEAHFLELQLDKLLAEEEAKLADGGEFRPGGRDIAVDASQWKDEGNFFAIPGWLSEKWEKARDIVVIYSGGKDSTAAALWAARNRADKNLLLVFADPGVEFPGMSAHVEDVTNALTADMEVVKSHLDWWTYLTRAGRWPSLLYRDCATTFVHNPVAKLVKKLPPETTVVLTGSRATEAVRGSTKTENSELPTCPGFQHFAPCFFAQKETLAKIIEASKVPLWEGYSRGFVRTACWCCPGQCGEQALALETQYPGLANDVRRWEKRIGPVRPDEDPMRTFDDLVRAGRTRAERAARRTLDGNDLESSGGEEAASDSGA
jgi:3'-phosphoadenosine 5'-phosphosulfate sulfotransferase (PAPS reductase)/FAD synthetase